MGQRCNWRLFENAKLRDTSYTTILELNSMETTEENFFQIIQIMRNYVSVNEGVSRDFLTMAIEKAEEIIESCYWNVGAGQSMIEFIGEALIQVKGHNVLYDYEKTEFTNRLNDMMMDSVYKTLSYMNGKSNLVIDTMDFQVILFKEYYEDLLESASEKNEIVVLYLDDYQYDVPVSAFTGKLSMVGIVRWKSRIWEDDYK